MDPAALARLALLSAILAVATPGGAPLSTNNTPSAATTSASPAYVVQAGDTLYSIAVKYNTTIAALAEANDITDPNALAVGQELLIPGVPATTSAQAAVTATPTARGPTPLTLTPAPNPSTRPRAGASSGQAPTAAASDDAETYFVRAGDTLAAIAAQFGVSVEELERVNNIANPNLLAVGQRLYIPKAANSQTLPAGIALSPQVARQGNTLTLRVNTPGTGQVLGTFDQQELKFNRIGDEWIALAGVSRCATYIGNFPVTLTVRDTFGNPKPVAFEVRVSAGTFPTLDLTLTPEMSALLDPAIMNAENARVSQTVAPYTPGQLWTGLFRLPLDIKNPRVSSQFGERRSYNGGQPGVCGHEGQDFGVPAGTPVYAPADGVVVLATPLKVRGNVVLLDHGRGVFSGFFHMSEIDVKQGQRVKPGDLVGKVGSTGFSTGAHLHWSMWVNGIYVDPIQWTREQIP